MQPRALLLTIALCAGAAACERVEPPPPAPPAEFLVAAGDSVFWIRSEADGIRVRGAPMLLAMVGGRLAELYVTDEDLSFYDAIYVGQRLFKRDLVNGDSVQLFADTLMRALARNYAAANPEELPLGDEEVGSEDPRIVASAEIVVLDVTGPWASYEYRTDVDVIGRPSSFGLRRGVLDLRTGVPTTLDALLGRADARRLAAEGQRQWRELRDSTLAAAAGTADEALLREEYGRLSFDARSFGLQVERRRPWAQFALVQRGALAAANATRLGPIAIDEPAWWPAVAAAYPDVDDVGEARWANGEVTVVARPAPGPAPRVAFALRDAGGQEWPLGFVPAPVQRVMWLEDSLVAPGTREALVRAFDEAALYGDETRVAAVPFAQPIRPYGRHRPRTLDARTRQQGLAAPASYHRRPGAGISPLAGTGGALRAGLAAQHGDRAGSRGGAAPARSATRGRGRPSLPR
jgi:hypothetical protein